MRLQGAIFFPAFPAILLLAGNIPCIKLSPALEFLSRIDELCAEAWGGGSLEWMSSWSQGPGLCPEHRADTSEEVEPLWI